MNKKMINFMKETICYLFIVLILFWISRLLGFNKNSSPISFAIGATIGWLIVQGSKFVVMNRRNKHE